MPFKAPLSTDERNENARVAVSKFISKHAQCPKAIALEPFPSLMCGFLGTWLDINGWYLAIPTLNKGYDFPKIERSAGGPRREKMLLTRDLTLSWSSRNGRCNFIASDHSAPSQRYSHWFQSESPE